MINSAQNGLLLLCVFLSAGCCWFIVLLPGWCDFLKTQAKPGSQGDECKSSPLNGIADVHADLGIKLFLRLAVTVRQVSTQADDEARCRKAADSLERVTVDIVPAVAVIGYWGVIRDNRA